VRFAFVVDEAGWSDGAYGVCKYGRVRGNDGFEVAWCWCWSSAAWVEVFGDHLLDETGIVVQLLAHFAFCIVASHSSLVAAFDDELEALIEFVLNLFAVLEVFLWVLLEKLQLLVTIYLMSEPATVIM
jgi:hypothetical protein